MSTSYEAIASDHYGKPLHEYGIQNSVYNCMCEEMVYLWKGLIDLYRV